MKDRTIQFFLTPEFIVVAFFLLIHLPSMTYNLGFRDEGFFSYAAVRIAQGEVPYKDFFLTTTPGMYYMLAFFFSIFGPYIVIGKILYTVTAALLLIIFMKTFTFSSRGVRYTTWGLMAYILGAPQGTVASYDTYGVFFLLLTGYIYLHARKISPPSTYFFVGIVAAVTFLMKQSIGMLTVAGFGVLIIFFNKEKLKYLRFYTLGIGSVLGIFFAYFFIVGGLQQAVYHIFFFARDVKAHSQGFVIHRLIFLVGFIGFLLLFRSFSKRFRIGMLTAGICIIGAYVFSSPEKIGRLWTYLSDPVFYVMSGSFALALLLLFVVCTTKKKIAQKEIYLVSATMLSIITIAIGGSGFSKAFASITAPFFIPVLVYCFEVSGLYFKKYKNLLHLAVIPILILYLLYLFPRFPLPPQTMNDPIMITSTSNIPSATYLVIEKEESEDLQKLVRYIHQNTKPSEKILCFPYCPMLHVLTNRESASYYSFFYPEVFMATSQQHVIEEVKKAHTKIVVIQKKGSIEPEATQEDERLSLLRGYILKNYVPLFETEQFIVLERKKLLFSLIHLHNGSSICHN